MTTLRRAARGGAATLMFGAVAACSGGGGLGQILNGVLGNQGGNQVSGTVRGVDTRSQQIAIQQSNGQTVTLSYDNQTQVVYQNQNYPVTALERGDQVTARVQSANNGAYYTDLVQVDQSVSNAGASSGSGTVQALQGTVTQVDRSRGLFALDVGTGGTLVVSMPYNASRADVDRFQSLRPGQSVRLYGIFVNNSRVELQQFF
ncbi:MAG TPA: hypothetical protein VNA89_11135 [Gemmatimonadaceae bacterium]|nr:hypothetical protein [Gemmatimonadaceae bacterium]